MNRLNVFNSTYSPWKYPSNWIRNTSLFFRQFKWAYQRITRGFCDSDYWDLDHFLAELMAQSIKKLADETHGYPGTDEFPTYESWKDYLYEIVEKLRFSLNEDMYNPYEHLWLKTFEGKDLSEVINNRTPEEEEITDLFLNAEADNDERRQDALYDALYMIRHVWGNLWD